MPDVTLTTTMIMPLRTAGIRLRAWHRNHVTRRALRRLDTHRFDDIGLSEADVRRETAKWPWRR